MRLNYDTIERLAFWTRTIAEDGRAASAAVIIHEGNVEYPILQSGGWVFSSDMDWHPEGDHRDEPSDEFWTELHTVLQFDSILAVKESDYTPKTPTHEQHLISNVASFVNGEGLEPSYEFEWMIDQAEERYNE